MPGPSRIEELRRRVHANPASIAFAALAEEYRRAGMLDEAIAACRAGLQRHPSYLSARVTLGRALLDAGREAEAQEAFELVLRAAPENLAAVRWLAEIHQRSTQRAEAGLAPAHLDTPPAAPVTPDTPVAARAGDTAETKMRAAAVETASARNLHALTRWLDGVERVRRSRLPSLPA